MKIKQIIFAILLIVSVNKGVSQEKKFELHTIAFYNLENLFDTINDPNINDEEYLPNKGWTYKNYKKKLDNLSRVLVEIGTNEQQKSSPTIIGVCEIENRRVLEDLVKQPRLINKNYKIVHFDSPDHRGIDTGFLYDPLHFKPTSYINVPLYIYNDASKNNKKEKEEETDDNEAIDTKSKRIYTRDQLLVTGLLDGEEVSFIVNHWPSRSGGEKKSSPSREAAGALNRKIIDSLFKINPNAKVITMGDLNDGPYNKSVKKGLGAVAKKEDLKKFGVFNPMEEMSNNGIGSLAYRDSWDLFDQIMLTEPYINKDYSTWTYWKAGVFNKDFLIQKEGQYKGYPLRNSNGVPGFSDHFPVYVYIIREQKPNRQIVTKAVSSKKEISFTKNKEGQIEIPCSVNGASTSFVYDADVEDILISGKDALFLLKTGKVKPENYSGEQAYSLSDGRIPEGSTLSIDSIEFNGFTLTNVTAVVTNSISSPLVIGENSLRTLGKVEVNYNESTLSITK
jgi:predicted aspartyl protease